MVLDKIFKNEKNEFISFLDVLLKDNVKENYIYALAEAHAIDLIAKTISKCEIQTFEMNGKKVEEKRGDLYWTLNLQPNYNENGTAFLYKLVTKLLTEKTALIVINKKAKTNLLYIADTYEASNDILYGKTFKNVYISDEEGNSLKLEKTYNQNNAIYYSLSNNDLTSASETFKNNTAKILKALEKNFIRANTAKWRLKNPGGQPTIMDFETKKIIDYKDYKNKITEGLFSDEEAVVLLSQVFDLEDLNDSSKRNNKTAEDYESVVRKIGDEVANKWDIPLDIFYGSKTEKSTGTNDFITFAVDPYFELIEDGLNISLVGKESFIKGEYIQINRCHITHKDILESASGIDKLTANGFSRNETNKLLRLPKIDEDWADKHYITKNYGNVEGGAEENG
ncbi:MAG: phage portal protein [Clostridia bacterium]|nr:phage portal protein [Clostridia bacterium]